MEESKHELNKHRIKKMAGGISSRHENETNKKAFTPDTPANLTPRQHYTPLNVDDT